MLVLSRKVGEQVIIDDLIRVTIVSIQGNQVRVGFTAPAGIPIHREEVHRRLTEQTPEPVLVCG